MVKTTIFKIVNDSSNLSIFAIYFFIEKNHFTFFLNIKLKSYNKIVKIFTKDDF